MIEPNNNSDKKTLETQGVYKGADDRFYLFEDDQEDQIAFELCTDDVLKRFDLNSTKEVDQRFIIIYVVNQEDEHEEIELEIIDLKRDS